MVLCARLQEICDAIAKICVNNRDIDIPALIDLEYKASIYHECATEGAIIEFAVHLLRALGCKNPAGSPNFQQKILLLNLLPATGSTARSAFGAFFAAATTADPTAVKRTEFYWYWKNFCCWMYEVVNASKTAPAETQHIFRWLASRTQPYNNNNNAGFIGVVPYAVERVANDSIALTTLCEYCLKALQRNDCVQVKVTDQVANELFIHHEVWHGACFECFRDWTAVHRIYERVLKRTAGEITSAEYYEHDVLPVLRKMHEYLSGKTSEGNSNRTEREQWLMDTFF